MISGLEPTLHYGLEGMTHFLQVFWTGKRPQKVWLAPSIAKTMRIHTGFFHYSDELLNGFNRTFLVTAAVTYHEHGFV